MIGIKINPDQNLHVKFDSDEHVVPIVEITATDSTITTGVFHTPLEELNSTPKSINTTTTTILL